MTILPNKKNVGGGKGGGNLGSGKGSQVVGNGNNCSPAEVENTHHSGQHSLPLSIPALQPDNLGLVADRVFGSNLSSGTSIWSHNQNHSIPHTHGLALACPHAHTSRQDARTKRRFEKKLRKKGLIIKSMHEDGACLFRAVADQVYGDQEMHSVVRKHCMDYIAKNRDYFSHYVTEDFNKYVSRKRLEHVHGNHIEIQALSEMYNRTIQVFSYSTEPINTFHGTHQTDDAPIRLSYHQGTHYNSLVDPYKPTVGVGLGLPGYIPGSADKNLLSEALRQSEQVQLEQAMLEDKLRCTDWEATTEAMEEQIARESYLQWVKDNERRNRVARSPNASSSSATPTSIAPATSEIRSPRPRSHAGSLSPLSSPFGDVSFKNSPTRLSPPPSTPGSSRGFNNVNTTVPAPVVGTTDANVASPPASPPHGFQLLETPSFINQLPPEMFGMKDWEDAGVIAQVLAASQQEYLDNLKRTHEHSNSTPTSEVVEEPKTEASSSTHSSN